MIKSKLLKSKMLKGTLGGALFSAAISSGCYTANSKITSVAESLKPIVEQLYSFNRLKDKEEISNRCDASKETMEDLISAAWHSGFLAKTERVKKETLNNMYGTYGPEYDVCEKDGEACFTKNSLVKDHHKVVDTLAIGEILFCRGSGKEEAARLHLDKIMMHELFHDFWHNILTKKQRQEFSVGVKKFYGAMLAATTKESRLEFLQSIGIDDPKEHDYELFARLQNRRGHYAEQKWWPELFSIMAEKTYESEMIIPQQLRKFYQGLISEKALNRNKM